MLALQQAFPAKETKQSSIVCLQSCWIFGESFQFKYVRSIWPIFAFTDVTNCDGKAACFQKLMIAKPQASLPVLPVCKRRGSWQTQLSLPNCHPRNPTKLTDAEPLHLKRFSCPANTFYTDRASFAEKGVGCIMRSNSSSRKSHFAATDRCKLACLGWACHAEGHLGMHAMRIQGWSRIDAFKLS